MIHTEKQIENLVKRLLSDIEREYYENRTMYITYKGEIELRQYKKTIAKGWLVNVPVHDDQFNKEESEFIIIYVNDETLEFEAYLDCSMGRPVPMIAKKMDNGKYGLGFPQ